jgi:hypothetical protein
MCYKKQNEKAERQEDGKQKRSRRAAGTSHLEEGMDNGCRGRERGARGRGGEEEEEEEEDDRRRRGEEEGEVMERTREERKVRGLKTG